MEALQDYLDETTLKAAPGIIEVKHDSYWKKHRCGDNQAICKYLLSTYCILGTELEPGFEFQLCHLLIGTDTGWKATAFTWRWWHSSKTPTSNTPDLHVPSKSGVDSIVQV